MMSTNNIKVEIINQLEDNYSYIVHSDFNKSAVVVDPADARPIIENIKKNKLSLVGIIITHHHSDHTSGINDLIKFQSVEVFSPDQKINGTSKVIKENDLIKFDFIEFTVLSTPGHTLDHLVYYNNKHKILFSGDTLFRFGCGRVFEGTYEQMSKSLQKLEQLNDEIKVYCGHEYTLHNLKFLQSIFCDYDLLKKTENNINEHLIKYGTTMPFILGDEKKINPFLSLKSEHYSNFMIKKDFNLQKMFKYLRDLRNGY